MPDGRNGRFEIKTILLCALLFLMIGSTAGCPGKTESPEVAEVKGAPKIGVDVGDLATDFKLKNLKGSSTTLSEFRGKVVLINFWATWCGPCKAEMPSMEALYRSHSREDFEILALSIDTIGEPPVRMFVEEFGFTFPILMDDEFMVNDYYQNRVVPTSLLIDRKGIIAHRVLGAKDWNDPESRKVIDELIQAKG